jgi:hypothetical protein
MQLGIRCNGSYRVAAQDQWNFEEKVPAVEHGPYFSVT